MGAAGVAVVGLKKKLLWCCFLLLLMGSTLCFAIGRAARRVLPLAAARSVLFFALVIGFFQAVMVEAVMVVSGQLVISVGEFHA